MIINFLKLDQGTITIAGQPLDEKSLDQIGFLPEERGLYLDMTILDDYCPNRGRDHWIWFRQIHATAKQG